MTKGASASQTGPLAEGGAAKASPAKPSVPRADGSLPATGDPMNAVVDAEERMVSFVAAMDSAGSYDAKRELFLQAVDDSQFERDLRTLFGTIRDAGDPA